MVKVRVIDQSSSLVCFSRGIHHEGEEEGETDAEDEDGAPVREQRRGRRQYVPSLHLFAGHLSLDRVPTRPGKPGKMRVHPENLEISWNFEKVNKNHGKII